jgi:parallel beta-helix repeat protein
MIKKLKSLIWPAIAGLCLAAGPSPAAILNVPAGYPTIQDAINAAAAGDEVHVAPGNYPENITMKSSVDVYGAGAPGTIITNPSPTLAANVTFDTVSSCTLAYFTITGADFTEDCYEWASAVYITASTDVSVNECVIRGNKSSGVMVYNGSIAGVLRCILTGNADPAYGFGPAIYTSSSETWVEGCEIINNNDGGIESCYSLPGETYIDNLVENNAGSGIQPKSGYARVEKNRIVSNNRGISCGYITGSGAYNYPEIIGNLIARNSNEGIKMSSRNYPHITNNIIVENGDAGIEVQMATAAPIVTNNTIVGNATGVYNSTATGMAFVNNIVASNTSYGIYFSSGTALLNFNDVWNNGTDYNGIVAAPSSISSDPLFFWYPDPWIKLHNYDFHLKEASPCATRGHPAAVFNDPDGSRNDIGAYGGPKTEEYAVNAINRPRTPAGIPLTPAYTAIHNLSGAIVNVDVEVSIVNMAGVPVYNTVTGYALTTSILAPIPMIPGLPVGNYSGKATMTDTGTMTIIGEDSFEFRVF